LWRRFGSKPPYFRQYIVLRHIPAIRPTLRGIKEQQRMNGVKRTISTIVVVAILGLVALRVGAPDRFNTLLASVGIPQEASASGAPPAAAPPAAAPPADSTSGH
jgi:hypothetical protein